jgi:hypothetical protein
MLKQGIILLATGNPFYGRMAYNAVLSIKAIDKDFPIALISDTGALTHLSTTQREIFDIHIPADGLESFGAKLHLDLLSPFEQTLYMDVDMAWFPKRSPRDLIRSLKEHDFASITEGHSDDPHPKYYFWADLAEIRQVYPVDKVYQWRSEVMYFTRSERVIAMFASAREIYANPGLNTIHRFGQHIPDELAINIATALHGIEPHEYKWTPAYWPRLHGESNGDLDGLYTKYYALSCGSNAVSPQTTRLYDRVIKAAAYKMGLQYLFPMINKKEVMKSRQQV